MALPELFLRRDTDWVCNPSLPAVPAKPGQAKQRHMARFPEDADSEECGGSLTAEGLAAALAPSAAVLVAGGCARAERGAGLGVAVLQVPGEDHALV